jgi:RecQ-mediated genome instability protein 1
MLRGTGLPGNVEVLNDVRLGCVRGAGRGGGGGTEGGGRRREGGVVVQIEAITEIGSSAFNLMGVMKAREERGVVSLDPDDVGEGGGGREDEDEGPLQRYPRGMLRLVLSDGSTRIQAIEYRSIPQLELGVTPLGYKVRSLLPSVTNSSDLQILTPLPT